MTIIYCARWVLPVSSPPIEDGAVAVEGELITAVDQRLRLIEKLPTVKVKDFGDAIILPGLVNSHSHLELTAMRGFLDNEEGDFLAWLKKLTKARLERMTSDDLYVSAAWGACEAARAGITCVGDASSAAFQSMSAVRDVGLRGTVFQESFGPDPRLVDENLETLKNQISRLRTLESSCVRVGVSPHAPYSVSAPQLKRISEFALDEKLPLMMHAAESAAEKLLLCEGRGLFATGLAARGIDWTTKGTSSIQYLRENGVLETRPLLAHCINVDDTDIETIRITQTRVAHCPKSNARLGHGRAPLKKFLAKGIVVGLGSDSVASNNTCDLLEEARFATLLSRIQFSDPDTHPVVSPGMALATATVAGTRALGVADQTGELRTGLQADLAVVSLTGTHQVPSYDPVSTLIFASSGRDVVMTVVAGREIFRDGRVTTVDEAGLRSRVKEIAQKLRS
jgi:5-methylthioadenosine/S-adenosylhomocysteine deaminase